MINGIVMLRHRQLCCDSVSVQLLQIGVATQFVCRDSISVSSVATMFLVLSAFLSRPGKSVATDSCLHLT